MESSSDADGAVAAGGAAASPNARENSDVMAAVEADASRRASEALEIVRPVPKKGSSRSIAWTASEALCGGEGWGQTTADPVIGTIQGMQASYDNIVVNIRDFIVAVDLPQLDKRLERLDKRIERMLCYDITSAVH